MLTKIETEDKTKYDTLCSHSKPETIINESDMDDLFESICTTTISNIQKHLEKDWCWIIDSVIKHNISISKYNPLAGSNYIKLPKEFDHQIKRIIDIPNIDNNGGFKGSLVRYLNPTGHNPRRIKKVIKILPKSLILNILNFQSKSEIYTKLKKRLPSVLVFLLMKIRKNIQSMY